jgi:putative colanic acid biosynthesis UDP-glucose lipid carrier transferase
LTFSIKQTLSKGIILGAGVIGQKIFDEMLRNVYHGVVIYGFFDDNPEKNDILGNIEDAKEYILKEGITFVFCALPHTAEEKIKDFIKFCESNMINFRIVQGLGFHNPGSLPIVEHIGHMPVFVLRHLPLNYAHNAFMKRLIDVFITSCVIIVVFPILFPILSILIKLSSPGPVLFKQKRTGRRGKEFYCYKFRTMRTSNDAHTKQATADDSRKTKIGNILRRTSLDELPQLINVLIGNMSLVGPRPHMLKHTDEYSPKVDKYMVRHFVKPGITGLAQVTGYRGETKDVEFMEKRVLADIEYIENWTLRLDFEIMFKTVYFILKGDEKAY